MADVNKICPDCGTENEPVAKRCKKEGCNYPLKGHEDVERVVKTIAKNRKQSATKPATENNDDGDIFDGWD